jgi:sulfite reductase (ferredoxin)
MEVATQNPTIPIADRRDIEELERRILAYQRGREDEERFKHYRLTRGVYGQRQFGVQMFRTKIPYGRITAEQLTALADISEKYTNGRLHLTTRQNIQLHYIKLQDSPAIWRELAENGLTAREACGNTVRNLTASPMAGIDPQEPFDVAPYVQASFEYFLRNPICQEMGRKIKPAFSSSEHDSAFTYFHDFGFIPRLREKDGQEERGFKVVIGGGLGAVSMIAHTAYEFLPADQIIPFMEAAIRVFDRYGEREKRMKARMKFLIKDLGFERFMELVQEEWPAIANKDYAIAPDDLALPDRGPTNDFPAVKPIDPPVYASWLKTNVVVQKQPGYRAVRIRVPLGNLDAEQTRLFAATVRRYAANDIRLTVNQGLLLRFVPPSALPHLFNALYAIQLALPGFSSTADVMACPGTDTCALGVTNSTGLATRLEQLVLEEYPEMVEDNRIQIKISGCMNACGQHMAANIGFHGSSIRVGEKIVPAMQVVLGGGITPDGRGFIADKVIKLPTKRIPQAVRILFADYAAAAEAGTYYNDYVAAKGKRYFYGLLKELGQTTEVAEEEYFDWGQDHDYRQEIGVGECAGVALDVVGTILLDAQEKIADAHMAVDADRYADAAYHAYRAMVVGAKALLLGQDIKCNTHIGILADFQEHFVATGSIAVAAPFPDHVLRIKRQDPEPEFVRHYVGDAEAFLRQVIDVRARQLSANGGADKLVIDQYYKA